MDLFFPSFLRPKGAPLALAPFFVILESVSYFYHAVSLVVIVPVVIIIICLLN